jgi:hypothetical protein
MIHIRIDRIRFLKAYQTWAEGIVYYIEIRSIGWVFHQWHWHKMNRFEFRWYKIEKETRV